MRFCCKLILLVLLNCFSFYAKAQSDTVRIKPVEVYASANDTVSLVFNAGIRYANVNLQIKDYGPGQISTVSIMGLPARHTYVGIDELDIVPGYLGLVDFSVFPAILFDRAVLSVGQSENTGALGGSISFRTNFSDSMQIGNVSEFGSFGYWSMKRYFSGSTGKVWFKLIDYEQKADNNFPYKNDFLPTSPVVRMQHAGFYQHADLLNFAIQLEKGLKINVLSLASFVSRQFPAPISYQGVDRFEYQLLSENYTLASVNFYNGRLRLKTYGGWIWQNGNYALVFAGNRAWNSPMTYFNFQQGLRLDISKFALGFKSWFERYENQFFAQGQVTRIFAQRKRAELWAKMHGFRNCPIKGGLLKAIFVDKKPYWAAWLGVKFGDLEVNVGQNINLPSLNDLYWQPGGNSHLLPERAQYLYVAYSAGLRQWSDVTVSFYYSPVKNWILWRPTEYHYWQAENIGRVKAMVMSIKGTMASVKIKRAKVWADCAYSFQSVVDSLDGQLIYTPKHRVMGGVNVKYDFFRVSMHALYESRRYVLPGNSQIFLPGYFVPQIRITVSNLKCFSAKCSLNFWLNNFTNSQYQLIINRPEPGINYKIGLKLTW